MTVYSPEQKEVGSNLAWRSHLKALSDDWKLGEVEADELFKEVMREATPGAAAESLEIIGEEAASLFDHWFVARYGDKIELVTRPFWRGWLVWYDDDRPNKRVVEAFHRVILNRREIT